MSRLVPFPHDIGSFHDADLLDLNVSVRAGALESQSAQVEAWARYATGARVAQVRDYYVAELTRIGAAIDPDMSRHSASSHVASATLDDDRSTRLRISVEECPGYRAVKLAVAYDGFDHRTHFSQFADWHNGSAPVAFGLPPTGVEISTFADGRRRNTLVLYSTYYDCPETSWSVGRAMVGDRIDELGWTYREPREGIMFIQDGSFDAETHVLGDENSSSVTFVGEFQLD